MGQVLSLPFRLTNATLTYYRGFFHFWCGRGRHGPYQSDSFAPLAPHVNDSTQTAQHKQNARIHLFSLAANFYLYTKPHYRKATYRQDLLDNLRNVAVPGTGMPLSWMAVSRWCALPYLLLVNPAICYVASLHHYIQSGFRASISAEYKTRLLAPDDWFHYWRLNCNIVALHSLLNDMPVDYEMENKWTFLCQGEQKGVPVSPFLKIPRVVIKHRNEEGGLGIYFYQNATAGGDWIIQEALHNSDWVASLLPPNAPLSTFRVITCSRAYDMTLTPARAHIAAVSCVFRAGRAGAATDHDSILFDVDIATGRIRNGTTNAHWYRLGPHEMLPGRCPWRSTHDISHHPDGNIAVAGQSVPNIAAMRDLVEDAHLKMLPRVPMCGWDVVVVDHSTTPLALLEANLSPNFFRSSFSVPWYLDFCDEALTKFQAQRLTADAQGENFRAAKS